MAAWTEERMAAREAFLDKVDAAIKAGLCHMCGKPVAEGAALHGPTGAHWECHQAPLTQLDELLKEWAPEPRPQAQRADRHPRMALANGGHLVHFVIPATGYSLCGHKPKNNAYHMKKRGKWLFLKEQVIPPAYRQCEKCVAKAITDYPPIEEEG